MRRLAFGIALGLLALAPASWGQEGPPAIVALTLDTSGSIRPELIEQTRALAVFILEALPQGSELPPRIWRCDRQTSHCIPRRAFPTLEPSEKVAHPASNASIPPGSNNVNFS